MAFDHPRAHTNTKSDSPYEEDISSPDLICFVVSWPEAAGRPARADRAKADFVVREAHSWVGPKAILHLRPIRARLGREADVLDHPHQLRGVVGLGYH